MPKRAASSSSAAAAASKKPRALPTPLTDDDPSVAAARAEIERIERGSLFSKLSGALSGAAAWLGGPQRTSSAELQLKGAYAPRDELWFNEPPGPRPASLVPERIERSFVGAVLAGRWEIRKAAGKGAVGRGWVAYDTFTAQRCFIKTLRSAGDSDEWCESNCKMEMRVFVNEILRDTPSGLALPHEHVISSTRLCFGSAVVKATGQRGELFFFVTAPEDLCEGGDLYSYLVAAGQPRSFAERFAVHLFRQMILGVQHLHSHSVAHRDLKLENTMVTADFQLKLMDFGHAKLTEHMLRSASGGFATTTQGVGTYRAPEKWHEQDGGASYDPMALDVHDIGIALLWLVAVELLVEIVKYEQRKGADGADAKTAVEVVCSWLSRGRAPFWRTFDEHCAKVPAQQKLTPELRDLLWNCLNPEPRQRFTADQIQQSPWLQGARVTDAAVAREMTSRRSRLNTKIALHRVAIDAASLQLGIRALSDLVAQVGGAAVCREAGLVCRQCSEREWAIEREGVTSEAYRFHLQEAHSGEGEVLLIEAEWMALAEGATLAEWCRVMSAVDEVLADDL